MDTEYPVEQIGFLVGAEREISAGRKSGRFRDSNGELLLSKFASHLVYIALYVARLR